MRVWHAQEQLAYRFAHLPLPDDAVVCDPWAWHDEDDWPRHLLTERGRGWHLDEMADVQRHQLITRWKYVGGDDQCDIPERTQLIPALTEAALYDT